MTVYERYIDFLKKDKVDIENLVTIIKVGSALYWDDPVDNDYLAIVKNYLQRSKRHIHLREEVGIVDDYFVIDEDYYKGLLNAEIEPQSMFESLCWINPIVVKPEHVIHGDHNYETKFENKGAFVKNNLKRLIVKFGLFYPKNGYIARGLLPKILYHVYLMLSLYKNKNTEITQQMLSTMRDIKTKKEGNISLKSWIEEELNTVSE